MFRSCLIFLAFLLGVEAAFAVERPDIEAFSSLPQYRQLKISPDGRHFAAVVATDGGESVLTVIDAEDMTIVNSLDVVGDRGVGEIHWASNDRIIASLIIKLGSHDRPFATGEWIAISVKGNSKGYIFGRNKGLGNATIQSDTGAAYLTSLLPNEPDKVLMTVYSGGRGQLVKLDVYSGRSSRVARLPGENSTVLADLSGEPRFATAMRAEENDNYVDIYRKKASVGWQKIDSFVEDDSGRVSLLSFINENELYIVDSISSQTETLVHWDLESGEKSPIYNHPDVDLDSYAFTRQGELYALNLMPDYPETVVINDDADESKWLQVLGSVFKGSFVRVTSASDDGKKVVAYVENDKFAPAYYLYEPANKTVKKVLEPYPMLSGVPMAAVNAVVITARDGVKLRGYLTLPSTESKKNLPTVVIPHGGPHGVRDRWGFDPEAQLLASRGYAVLQVNYRGSGGYGRDFLYSGYKKWGLEMQDDVTDATNWAVSAGIADKNRICIYGASYGGYAALMGGIREPDLYQCIVGYVGVYDLEMMFDTGDVSQRKSGINYLNDALGTDPASLRERSPVYHVKKLKAPLMIVHGEKDIRAHFDHALALRHALDEINYEYEWLVKEKEAHGFVNRENRKELYTRLISFLDAHIGSKEN